MWPLPIAMAPSVPHELLCISCSVSTDPQMAGLEAALDQEVAGYRASTFAANTSKVYKTHLKTYMGFCLQLGYNPVPVQPIVLSRYIAFLARKLKYTSIKQYLNIVSLLHKEYGYSFNINENWRAQSVLRGIKREKGNSVTKKLPITPSILLQIKELLQMQSVTDANFWAACLVAFFGLLRKTNLLPVSAISFVPSKNLARSHFSLHSWGLAVKILFSKTNQFQERELEIALPSIPGHPLCPVTAVLHAFSLSQAAPLQGQPSGAPAMQGYNPSPPASFHAS